MLDKGFEPDIRAIIGMTKSHEDGRHTNMFSATWPPAVRGLAETFMRSPVRVTVGSDELSANRRVSQSVEVLQDGRAKERRLGDFLRSIQANKTNDKILIFALYKKEAQRVESTLRRWGYRVSGIHGDLSQKDRIASLNAFKTAETPLLVATDVAARGLDIPNVELVINYTFPLSECQWFATNMQQLKIIFIALDVQAVVGKPGRPSPSLPMKTRHTPEN